MFSFSRVAIMLLSIVLPLADSSAAELGTARGENFVDRGTSGAVTMQSNKAHVLVQRWVELGDRAPAGTLVWLRDDLAYPTRPLYFYGDDGELLLAIPPEHFPVVGVTLADGEVSDRVLVAFEGQARVRKQAGVAIVSGSVIVPGDEGAGVVPQRAWCEGAMVGVAVDSSGSGEETVLVEFRLSAALQAVRPLGDASECSSSLGQGRDWDQFLSEFPEMKTGKAMPWLAWAADEGLFFDEYYRALEARR